jgi:hypothetical protein
MLAADGSLVCSGVLVSPTLALTAGHCDVGIARVALDTVDLEHPVELIDVERTIVHPELWTTFDVTAVVLASPATTAPREVARGCRLDWLVDGADAVVVGWGAIDRFGREPTTILQEAALPVVDADCADAARGCNPAVLPEGELIAGGEGVDSCSGDSGGPLYLRTPDGDVLVGLTSRAALPSAAPCGDGGIYVRADAILPWLAEVAGFEPGEPTCESARNDPPVVEVGRVYARSGVGARVPLVVVDEDPDPPTISLEAAPARGEAWTDEAGRWWYRSDPGYVGEDALSLRIADPGSPPHVQIVEVPIEVVAPPPEPATCATATPRASTLAAALALALALRRRQKAQSSPSASS